MSFFKKNKIYKNPLLACAYHVHVCHRAYERKTKVNYSFGYGLLERRYSCAHKIGGNDREREFKRRSTRTDHRPQPTSRSRPG